MSRLSLRHMLLSSACGIGLLSGASHARAAEAGATAGETAAGEVEMADAGDTIIVDGKRIPYGVRTTSTATKTNTDVRNVPQALTIVSSAS